MMILQRILAFFLCALLFVGVLAFTGLAAPHDSVTIVGTVSDTSANPLPDIEVIIWACPKFCV
jgi:ABC-type Fe3+-siderophore transport system permease subunit